jgi:prevent-host-death family protein
MTHMATRSQFNIAEAKASFSQLVQRALMGEDVVIARDNKPLVRLVPLATPEGNRMPGSAKGRIRISPDFDATPEDFAEYA